MASARAAAALGLLLAASGAQAGPERRVLAAHYSPQDRASGRYQYLPFDVPAGTTRLTVTYHYDPAGGASVVDLGLFEPGSLDLGSPAFRGYSGGGKQTVTLTEGEATPAYWPGPLPPGQWHALLGLYKVADSGVDVQLIVETSDGPEAAPVPLPRRPQEPLRRGARWYSGGLHSHTTHSDGAVTPAEICALARAAGLDFLAITDHNNTTHQTEALPDDGVLHIVGEEVTTPAGHASVWGLGGARDYVDWRVGKGDPRIGELVTAAVSKGALFSINHPFGTCASCAWEHAVPEGVAAMEVANGGVAEMAQAIAMWDGLLKQGRRIVGVGASDWHHGPGTIDVPSVRVWASELSTAAVLDGIRRGHVVVMSDGRTPPPLLAARVGGRSAGPGDGLRARPGDTVRVDVAVPPALRGGRVDLVWDGAVVASQPATGRVRFARQAADGRYLRVHVFGADGAPRAITNPVYLESAP